MSRIAQFFLFLSLLASILLHWEHLPWWSLCLSASAMVWRMAVYIFDWSLPGLWIKGAAVVSGFVGVYLTFGWQPSIESMVALLVTGVALKPLEVQRVKESYLLVFLCVMVQGMHFLFEQEPIDYLLVLGCFVLSLQSLFALHHKGPVPISGLGGLKYGAKIFWMSLPLTLVFFFILPRLNPLWTLNIKTEANRVGLSESMSPGDISELGRNTELAFRVRFDSERVPLMSERYWRALVLDHYDGKTWNMRFQEEKASLNGLATSEAVYRYRVTQPANDQRWLFSLENSMPMTEGIQISKSGFLSRKIRNVSPFQFSAFTVENRASITLDALEKYAYLQLPPRVNPKTRQLARDLAVNQKGVLNVPQTLAAISQLILTEDFSYTLNPGQMDSSSRVDEFLFEKKQGFCAHYAGALVFMLRSMGVPSRVVVGYHGGEYNKVSGDYSVYQYDAHAWVEYWEGGAWQRVDPTGWVSPERVDQGLEASIDDFAGFKTDLAWLNDLRLQMQALNYYWQDWMLEYKGEKQQALLDAITGQTDSARTGMIIGLSIILFTAIVVLWLLFSGRTVRSYERKLNDYLIARLKKQGEAVYPGMTFSMALSLVQDASPKAVASINDAWNAHLYKGDCKTMTWREYLSIKQDIRRLFR